MNYKAKTGKNTIETFTELGSSIGRNTVESFISLADWDHEAPPPSAENKETYKAPAHKIEHTIFRFQEQKEHQEVQQLTQELAAVTKQLKQATTAFNEELVAAENEIINAAPEQQGVYRIRFLESMIAFFRKLIQDVGESRTWMSAMVSKKKKRGSAFAINSKKHGTQFSLSQELATARAIQ